MSQEDMSLEKALEIIKQIAERYDRDMQACAMAGRSARDRRDAIHDQAAEGSDSGGHEPV